MSINSMANSAIARRPDFRPEGGPPKGMAQIAMAANSTPKPTVAPDPSSAGAVEQNTSAVNSAMNLLIGYIPTEILTLYVAVLKLTSATETVKVAPLTVFGIFLVATPVVVWLVFGAKLIAANKPIPSTWETWPVWEMVAATVAFAAWAWGLPDSPLGAAGLGALAVLIASTVLGLLAPFFQHPLATGNQPAPGMSSPPA